MEYFYMSEQLRQAALDFHEFPIPGKIAVTPTKSLETQHDLALAYSPGVAEPCLEIEKDLAEGKYTHVQTRFPPEPNGYLHIGHAKSILLNSGLAEEYKGKFNLRFDDTNPTKEKEEFVDSIKEDVNWLGADYEDRLFFASNYFDEMYEKAVLLIQK